MTVRSFYKLIDRLRANNLTDEEAERCAAIIVDFADMCEELANEDGCEDIFGTEGWEHRIGID